jgi:outer membrane murein-binding lipoprotein Lpp
MPANCPVSPSVGSAVAIVLAALVLAGCGGPATIEPAAPSAEEIRESERALEAAAAAEKSLPAAADR